MNLRAGIVGFRGYSGAELVRILEHHPNAEPVLLEHRSDSEDRPLPAATKAPPAPPPPPKRSSPKASPSSSSPHPTM